MGKKKISDNKHNMPYNKFYEIFAHKFDGLYVCRNYGTE